MKLINLQHKNKHDYALLVRATVKTVVSFLQAASAQRAFSQSLLVTKDLSVSEGLCTQTCRM